MEKQEYSNDIKKSKDKYENKTEVKFQNPPPNFFTIAKYMRENFGKN